MPEISIGRFKLYVEIPVLLIFFAFMLSDSVNTNLIIYRTCYVSLGFNKSECALLGQTHKNNKTNDLETMVQPYAAVINMIQTFFNLLFSSITCMFVGSWSDRFGRKPVLLIPVFGYVLNYLLIVIFAALEDVSPWWYLATSLPVFLTGGASSYHTVSLCYVADVTSEKTRGFRMGIYEAVLSLGVLLGNISSSYVFNATDYPTVFAISGFCCLLNFIYTLFFIPETLKNRPKEGRLKGLFQWTNITDMMKTAFKKRPNHQRLIILCCVLILTVFILQNNGDGAVLFLFLREKFHWSLQKYTIFIGSYNVTCFLVTLIGVALLHKILKIPESAMILMSLLGLLNGALLLSIAKQDFGVFAGGLSRSLGGFLIPMVQSLVSKMVPNEEVGKIFALIVASESLFGMAGPPIYTAIYNSTITTNSAIFNFVSVVIYTFEFLVAIFVIMMVRNIPVRGMYDEVKANDPASTVTSEQKLGT